MATMESCGALSGLQQGEEVTGQPGSPGHVDAEWPGGPGHATGRLSAPRDARGLSEFVEFGPFLGQTAARGVFLASSVREVFQMGGADERSSAELAELPPAAHGERLIPTTDDEWLRVAAAAEATAMREEELDDERERFFEGEAADSEHERDAHSERLSVLHRAACLRRTSGSAFKHQIGSGRAASTVASLADAAAAVYRCRRPGCLALVDAGRARAAACRRSHGLFEIGDGCAGPRCATRWRRDRFSLRQSALALKVFQGRRRLVDWPVRVGGGLGERRSRASGARAALLAAAWLRELGLYEFE
jgi:hypothetical protein